jgi:hypothetical protein
MWRRRSLSRTRRGDEMDIKKFFEEEQSFKRGFLVSFIAAGLLQFLGILWTAAWILMVIAGFLGGFLVKRAGKGFLAGFLGVLLAWAGYLIIFEIIGPLFEFSNILAALFGLTGMGFVVIILSLVVIGGLIGGLGGLNGHFIAAIVYKKE